MKIIKVDKELIPYMWSFVSDLLAKPLDRSFGETRLEDIYTYLCEGYQDLWIVKDTDNSILVACNAQVVIYPTQKVYQIILVGGGGFKVKDWVHECWKDDSPIIQYAKEQGCVRIETITRDGLLKTLSGYDFKKTGTLVHKIIGEY